MQKSMYTGDELFHYFFNPNISVMTFSVVSRSLTDTQLKPVFPYQCRDSYSKRLRVM